MQRGPRRVGDAWHKTLRPGRGWQQASRAYAVVVPQLAAAGVPVPRLLAADAAVRTLVVSHLDGSPVDLSSTPRAFAAAGRSLRVLHSLPAPADPVPLDTALRARAAAAVERLGREAWVVDAVGRVRGARVWCHRDLQPQNWIDTGGERMGLIDFEHTRPDHPLVDLVRLEARGWSEAQRAAFLAGWGQEPGEALGPMLALYGLQTVVWAGDHEDEALLAVGERALDVGRRLWRRSNS